MLSGSKATLNNWFASGGESKWMNLFIIQTETHYRTDPPPWWTWQTGSTQQVSCLFQCLVVSCFWLVARQMYAGGSDFHYLPSIIDSSSSVPLSQWQGGSVGNITCNSHLNERQSKKKPIPFIIRKYLDRSRKLCTSIISWKTKEWVL